MKHLTHTDTAILFCFSCAQIFPCLHASKDNPTHRDHAQRNNSTTYVSSPFRVFEMSKKSAIYVFGLAKCCTRCGNVSGNVILSEQ